MTTRHELIVRSKTETVFEDFLVKLHERRRAVPTRTMVGSAQWGDAPLMTMVADGLWPVVLHAAEKLDVSLTNSKAIEDVAERVDRVFRAGLLMRYASVEAAALAFWQEVVEPVFREARSAVGKGAVAPAMLWQVKAATFFAGPMRTATEARQKAERLIAPVVRQPFYDPRQVPYLRVVDEARTESVRTLCRHLRLEAEIHTEYVSKNSDYGPAVPIPGQLALRSLVTYATYLRGDAELLRRMPIRSKNLPPIDTMMMPSVSIEKEWLRTQVLLAAARAKVDVEYLHADSFVTGMRVVRSTDPARSIERVIQRMEKRGLELSASERQRLSSLVSERVFEIRDHEWDGGAELLNQQWVFLDIPIETLNIDALEALDMALDTGKKVHLLMSVGADRYGWENVQQKVADDIVWHQLTDDQIVRLLAAKVLTGAALFSGLSKVPAERLLPIIHRYLDSTKDAEFVSTIFEGGVVAPDEDLLHTFFDVLPTNMFLDGLPVLFATMNRMKPSDFARFIEKLQDAPEQDRRRALENPICREAQRAFLADNVFVHTLGKSELEITRDEKILRDIYGDDLWTRFVLSEDILYRKSLYFGQCDDEEREQMFPNWVDRGDPSKLTGTWHAHLLRFDLPLPEITKLLKKYSEEEMLRWAAEGFPKPKAFIREYLKDRETYYRSWAHGAAPPAPKKK